ncbi:MAG TPA: hypothetical protein EYH56_02645 [Nanoarchaeota archaeon]|nr:hypothetical protein [Nanoarchaeota archaeon]
MTVDLVTLIFHELLKISPELLARYPTIQDKLLYLILIPHVVLFILLLFFANNIVRGHPRLKNLILIVSYIYVIYSGFYGSFVVPIAISWFVILLPLFFIGHLILRIFPYEKTPAIVALLYRAGAEPLRKAKLHELYIEELKSVNRALNYLFAQAGANVKIKETYTGDISDQVKKASNAISNLVENKKITNEQAKVWEEELNKLIRWREEIIRKLRHL